MVSKRILSLILGFAMIFPLCTTTSLAENNVGKKEQGITITAEKMDTKKTGKELEAPGAYPLPKGQEKSKSLGVFNYDMT